MILQFIILVLLSFFLTNAFRHYAVSKNILDIPNHRSSHVAPTPRGGGVVFVVIFLLVAMYLGLSRNIGFWDSLGFIGAGSSVALLGYIDDHVQIKPIWRLLGHFIASAFALFCLSGMHSISLLGWVFSDPILLNGFALFYLVWFLNLYNFMDGIDGIAAIETITICLGGVILYALHGNDSLMMLPLVLTAVVAGFLCLNFPPARIFMGDAGSGFLGLIIGMFTIQAGNVDNQFFWSWLILSGVFIVDATFTLFRRCFSRSKVYEAHRSHAYQHATDLLNSHFYVTFGVLAINVLWLLPLALLVSYGHLDGILGLLIAYLPLIILAFQFRAGKSD